MTHNDQIESEHAQLHQLTLTTVAEDGGPLGQRVTLRGTSHVTRLDVRWTRMIIGSCFDGDDDMALAGVQHDLYLGMQTVPGIWIDGGSTLW